MSRLPPKPPARPAGPATFFLALPSLAVFSALASFSLALIGCWSFWSFDPDDLLDQARFALPSYAALLKNGPETVFCAPAALAPLTATASTLLALPAATAIGSLFRLATGYAAQCRAVHDSVLHQRAGARVRLAAGARPRGTSLIRR